jgi:hypothetical protein
MKLISAAALAVASLACFSPAIAQNGPASGAVGGAIVGGAVGGPVGAAAGATAGGIAEANRPRFHSYVTERRHPSYRYEREVRVGAELPGSGVTYYEVPREYGSTAYRYTVVNDRTVLVDPGTHRIVEVIDYRALLRRPERPPQRRCRSSLVAGALICLFSVISSMWALSCWLPCLSSGDSDGSPAQRAPKSWTETDSLRSMAHHGEPKDPSNIRTATYRKPLPQRCVRLSSTRGPENYKGDRTRWTTSSLRTSSPRQSSGRAPGRRPDHLQRTGDLYG